MPQIPMTPNEMFEYFKTTAPKVTVGDPPPGTDWGVTHPIKPVVVPAAKQSTMKRFTLIREIDETGTSGTGVVAEGVLFSNGQVVIHWLSQLETIGVYANTTVLDKLHGHGGNTTISWID